MDEHNILQELKQINIYKSVISSPVGDIIDPDDAVIDEYMTKKERSLKIEYVKRMHITSEGKPRQIKPPTGSIKGWSTRVEGKKRITANTEDALFEKLYEYYSGMSRDTSFRSVFFEALEEISNKKSINTKQKYRQDFNRFINADLGKKKVSNITSDYLNNYTVDLLKKHPLPKKSFLGYKGLLNRTFEFAIKKGMIEKNPVSDIKNTEFYPLCHEEHKSPQEKAMSPEQIDSITQEIRRRMKYPKKYGICYTLGYMFLLSTLTGMRAAELCSFKRSDILEGRLHIHSQQLKDKETRTYFYAPWTKNEKGVSRGGRFFPITDEIASLLSELLEAQKKAGIKSEWLFANKDGSWILADIQYESFLHKICTRLGYSITNNHAIRMYFNSYVLIPKGVTITNRARLLGHSVEVNSRFYCFEDYDYCDSALKALNS